MPTRFRPRFPLIPATLAAVRARSLKAFAMFQERGDKLDELISRACETCPWEPLPDFEHGRYWARVLLRDVPDYEEVEDDDAIIGYDEPMNTYFFQSGIVDKDGNSIIWLGSYHGEFTSFRALWWAIISAGIKIIEWQLDLAPIIIYGGEIQCTINGCDTAYYTKLYLSEDRAERAIRRLEANIRKDRDIEIYAVLMLVFEELKKEIVQEEWTVLQLQRMRRSMGRTSCDKFWTL